MQFEFSVEDFKDVIRKYYEEMEGIDVTVDVLSDKAYGKSANYYDSGTLVGKAKIHGHIEAMGKEIAFSKTLKDEEVKEIFGEILSKAGFTLESIT